MLNHEMAKSYVITSLILSRNLPKFSGKISGLFFVKSICNLDFSNKGKQKEKLVGVVLTLMFFSLFKLHFALSHYSFKGLKTVFFLYF